MRILPRLRRNQLAMPPADHSPAAPAPRRVRVQGDLFHGRVPDGAVYVGRAAPGLPASPYANPFGIRSHGAAEAVRRYRDHLADHPELAEAARHDLAGQDLACWCKLPTDGEPDICHGAVLLEITATTRPAGSAA